MTSPKQQGQETLLPAHRDHRRSYNELLYVYPVISRRSRGVSIGINLNPDKICNFDCVYCEVDRRTPARVKKVDLALLRQELQEMLRIWADGSLFENEPFASAPLDWRRLNDIAFSGDGEPTTYPLFEEAVAIAAEERLSAGLTDTKLVLITDAACLERPAVRRGLERMIQGPHEIWAKLDAGTEDYFRMVNRTAIPLARILGAITATARTIPLWIQSLFMRLHEAPPSSEEITAYIGRLQTMLEAGAHLHGVQAYTIARPTPERWVSALSKIELDQIASRIASETGLKVESYYGA